jgi:hypothetical protein
MLWLEFINMYRSPHIFEKNLQAFQSPMLPPSSRNKCSRCIKRLYGYRRGWVETEVVRVPKENSRVTYGSLVASIAGVSPRASEQYPRLVPVVGLWLASDTVIDFPVKSFSFHCQYHPINTTHSYTIHPPWKQHDISIRQYSWTRHRTNLISLRPTSTCSL